MSPDPPDPKEKSDNISQRQADDMFNNFPDIPGNDQNPDNVANNQERSLAEQENNPSLQGGENSSVDNSPENSFYTNDTSTGQNFITRGLAGAKKSFGKGSVKKKLIIGAASGSSVGLIAIIAIIVFMLISGFGLGQVAVVIENYASYRVNRIGHNLTARVLESDVRLKGGAGLTTRVSPSSFYTKLKGFDVQKVIANLEKTNRLVYVRDGNVVTGVKVGDADVIPIERGSSATGRVESLNKLKDALRRELPELSEKGKFVGGTADGIFERIRLDKVRWKESALAKLRGAGSSKEALALDNADQIDKVRGSPTVPTNSHAGINAATEVVEDNIDEAIESGDPNPLARVAPAQVDAIDASTPLLSRNVVGSLVEGVSTVAVYTLCTIDGITQAGRESIKQSNDASMRDSAQLFTAYDQYKAGKTNAKAVGAARANLGENFSKQAGYQRAVYNADWRSYDRLPSVDQPQPNTEQGWLGTFATISDGANTAWDNTVPVGKFSDFCGFINNPAGGLAFGITTGLIENFVIGALSGGTSTAASQGAEVAIRQGVEEAVEVATREATSATIRTLIQNTGRNIIEKREGDSILRAVTRKAVRGAVNPQNAAVAGATIGMTYLVVKLADSAGGYAYTGMSDDQAVNKDAAGANVFMNDVGRTRYYGVPLDGTDIAYYSKQQYAEHKTEQHEKSFFARILDVRNPYSAATQVAIQTPTSASAAKTFAVDSISPFALLSPKDNPASKFIASALMNEQIVRAQSESDTELATDGVEQWGLTPEEERLMISNDDYSVEGITQWSETVGGSDIIDALDSELAPCYSTDKSMSDFLLDDGLKEKCLKNLKIRNANDPTIFKWRLYKAYGIEVDELVSLETVTANNATSGGGGSGGISGDPLAADSSATPCAAGTTDLGIRDDAYTKGSRIKVRLCALTITSGSDESTPGSKYYVEGANGKAIVNSVVSGGWQELINAAQAAGIPISATSSWRTMAHQEDLCNENPGCRSGSYNGVARPGTSNHQAGTAIDISEAGFGQGAASGRSCANPQSVSSSTYIWLAANAKNYGIKQYANESWHWGASEAC